MIATLMAVALLMQSGGFRAGRAGSVAPVAPEGVVNAAGAQLEIVTHAIFQNGDKRETGRFLIPAASGANTAFVYAPSSACDPALMSDAAPQKAAHAWQVTATPTRRGIPAEVRAAVSVGWKRILREGARGNANGFHLLQVGPPRYVNAVTLDMLSGKQILIIRRMESSEQARRDLTYLKPTAECPAIDMSIEGRLLEGPKQPVIEAELWLVHTAPGGQETTQRQTVRVRGHSSLEFFFDPIKSVQGNEPVVVRVSGKLEPSLTADGRIRTIVTLKRVFHYPATATTTRAMMPFMSATGEVVSLEIPGTTGEAAASPLPGHKFSVRMRLKPLDPNGN